jgi:hypothetical protein
MGVIIPAGRSNRPWKKRGFSRSANAQNTAVHATKAC